MSPDRERARPRAGLPAPESWRRRLLLRTVAVAAVLVTLAYLVWRVTSTLPTGPALAIGIPFLLLEAHGFVTLVLYVLSTWDVDPPVVPPQWTAPPSVTVLIATYDEHLDVLLPTVAACVAMDGEHETWVLDDGGRLEVAEMVTALGARYVTRPVHDHAKAGNLNAALAKVGTALVAVFDADHVPEPDFLTRTLPYFADPRVALVQTPQDFYNTSSFEHLRPGSELHEESLFYRVIQAGKHNAGAAHWCGTNAVLRVAALREVGGVATETITEDFHTTMRLHRAGWRSVYHNEVLASGLAANGPEAFYAQRRRWGRGAMQVVRVDNPLTARGLAWGQRLAYAYSLAAWFDAWRTLGLAVLPVAVLVTGLFPVDAPAWQFLGLAGSAFLLQQLTVVLLARGFARTWFSLLFDMVRLPSNLAATLSLVVPGSRHFAVTAKGRTGDERTRARVPAVLAVLAWALAATVVHGVVNLSGLSPAEPAYTGTALVPLVWSAVTLGFVLAAVRRIRHPRYAAERREGHRFPALLPSTVAGAPGRLVDVSLGGAQVEVDGPVLPPGRDVDLAITVPDRAEPVVFRATVLRQQERVLRLHFVGRQWLALAALSATAFGAGAARWRPDRPLPELREPSSARPGTRVAAGLGATPIPEAAGARA